MEGTSRLMGRQLLRAGTSVGANYRAVCRARSKTDMIAKLKIVEEEADEAGFWLEVFEESGWEHAELVPLKRESYEILAIAVASIKTLRAG
jgi:four helix bundle protein